MLAVQCSGQLRNKRQCKESFHVKSVIMFILTQVLIPVALLLVAVAPLTANSEEVNSSTTEYGFLKDFTESNRIVGGHEATRGQFPHQVSVRDRRFGTKYSHRCGGSIITNRFVLTAAHCFQRRLPQPERYRIVAGAHQNNDNDGIVYNVRRWILHEGFLANFTQPNPQVRNDIALIETTTTIRFNRLIRLITLHTGFIGSGTTAVVSGWGSTNVSNPVIRPRAKLIIFAFTLVRIMFEI